MSQLIIGFLQQTAALTVALMILSLPAYVFLTYCWRLGLQRDCEPQSAIDRLDWPQPGSSYIWRLKHQWRVAIYGAPKEGCLSDPVRFAMNSFHRLGRMSMLVTYVILAIVCIGILPAMLIPLLAAGAWVLIRTPNWPETARSGP
ncbi:hypothetical protein [Roseovarius nanhaiticus]|uniref:hypothetical protein n=1 Tax=Roseovarius nanhaiticus TaxID=573024 RepID=UPI0024906363|nr:hypothetical protein [Roseovarius nanhaiticus]